MGRWVSGRWVGGSVGRWSVVLIKPHKKSFQKQRSNSRLVLHAYKSQTSLKNVATGIMKKKALPALNEAKHVSRIFITYFDNDKLKNETRELVKNLTTAFLTF